MAASATEGTRPPGRPSGFTLTVDGAPDEVGRVLAAVWREMADLESAAVARYRRLWGESPTTSARTSTLRGAVEVRYPLSRVPDDLPPPGDGSTLSSE